MGEAVQLRHDGRLHLRVQVPGVEHGDAGTEIDVALAFDIGHLRVLRMGGEDRIGSGDAARDGRDPP